MRIDVNGPEIGVLLMKKATLRKVATVLFTAGLVTAGVSSPATASPVTPQAVGDPAPVCIYGFKIKHNVLHYEYYVENHCSGTYRVRIALSLTGDGPCWTVARGQRSPSYHSSYGSYQGNILC